MSSVICILLKTNLYFSLWICETEGIHRRNNGLDERQGTAIDRPSPCARPHNSCCPPLLHHRRARSRVLLTDK